MTVGLLDMPGARFTRYWHTFLTELGLEVLTPSLPAEGAYALGRESLPDAPAQVQLSLGRLLELGQADTVLLPQARAVRRDAWSESLSELLPRRISGLPRLLTVPDGGGEMEGAAQQVGQQLTRNPVQVRAALGQARPLSLVPREVMPPLSAPRQPTLAVIGPDSLLLEPFLSAPLRSKLGELGLHPVYASDLPRAQVEERAGRGLDAATVGQPLPEGERDLLGAQGLLAGKGAVRGLLYVAPLRDAATWGALGRLMEQVHKPALRLEIDPDGGDFAELSDFAARLNQPSQEAQV